MDLGANFLAVAHDMTDVRRRRLSSQRAMTEGGFAVSRPCVHSRLTAEVNRLPVKSGASAPFPGSGRVLAKLAADHFPGIADLYILSIRPRYLTERADRSGALIAVIPCHCARAALGMVAREDIKAAGARVSAINVLAETPPPACGSLARHRLGHRHHDGFEDVASHVDRRSSHGRRIVSVHY